MAIEAALDSAAKERFLDMLNSLAAHPVDGRDSVEVLRRLRQERTNRLAGRHDPTPR